MAYTVMMWKAIASLLKGMIFLQKCLYPVFIKQRVRYIARINHLPLVYACFEFLKRISGAHWGVNKYGLILSPSTARQEWFICSIFKATGCVQQRMFMFIELRGVTRCYWGKLFMRTVKRMGLVESTQWKEWYRLLRTIGDQRIYIMNYTDS